MTGGWPARLSILWAGLMGAAGIVLGAAAAHQPDATRLASASMMLLFHAPALLSIPLLSERGLTQRHLAALATIALGLGAALFAGDLAMRQYLGQGLFPMAAPSGGTLMIAGWLMLGLAGVFSRPR